MMTNAKHFSSLEYGTAPHETNRLRTDAPGWDSDAIDALSATLKEYADFFPRPN